MATNKNITMKQYNGVDYDTLYPKTIASQIDDVFSKDETLSNSTRSILGLGSNTTPDDAFQKLAGGAFKRITLYQGVVHATNDDYAKYTTALPENAKFIGVAIGLSLSIVPVIDAHFIGGCTNISSGISGSIYRISITEFSVYSDYIACGGRNLLEYPISGGAVNATRSTSNFSAVVYAYY